MIVLAAPAFSQWVKVSAYLAPISSAVVSTEVTISTAINVAEKDMSGIPALDAVAHSDLRRQHGQAIIPSKVAPRLVTACQCFAFWCQNSQLLELRNSIPKFLFTIRPADVPGFSLGGRPAPLHAGLNAEDKHLPEEIGWPVVFLTSGQKLTLHKVMLYDEDGVQEAAKLRAQAASGVFVDFAQVTNNQSPHPSVWSAPVECKKRWENGSEWRRHVHNGDEFVNVETELGAMSIRWDQVAAYFPPQQSSEKLLIAPTEFSRQTYTTSPIMDGLGAVGGD